MSNEKTERDWKEDFQHENGNYQNMCCGCQQTFFGHKRRVLCKTCASPTPLSAEEMVKSYFEFDDVNQSETMEVLPLTLVDMLEEQTAQLRQQVEELKREAETQKGLATRYHQFWRDLIAKIEEERKWLRDEMDENNALKERNEKMEQALSFIYGYTMGDTDKEVFNVCKPFIEEQSLNKE